jgi:hypothetical protein
MFKALSLMKSLELKPKALGCREFTNEKGEVKTVTAVIVPIKFTPTENGTVLVGWACNHCNSCYNSRCVYAKALNSPNIL